MKFYSNEDKNFIARIARIKDCKEDTVKEWWETFFEYFVEELYVKGKVTLPDVGYIQTIKKKDEVSQTKDENGEMVYYYFPERYVPNMIFEDDFINDINMKGVTKRYRKRLTANCLSMRDKERERRAEAMCITHEDFVEKNTEECKENFLNKLKQKTEEKEESNGKK